MLQRFLLVWLVLSSLLAYYWPDVLAQGGGLFGLALSKEAVVDFDPFVATLRYKLLDLVIAVTMFSIGCLLPRDEIRQVLKRWPTVLGGTAIQYTVMPLIAFLAGRAFRLDDDALTGVILVGCVPGVSSPQCVAQELIGQFAR